LDRHSQTVFGEADRFQNNPCMNDKIVVMGVSGCGKSTLGARLASALRCDLIEGDDHHPPANRDKMAAGIALEDADRWPWLESLGRILRTSPGHAVLSCSALKRRYRDLLRQAVPGLRFVHLDIGPETAAARVAARPHHMFPATLVTSQFAALERPCDEAGVLSVQAELPVADQMRQVVAWLNSIQSTSTPQA
jgi:gluconokinase